MVVNNRVGAPYDRDMPQLRDQAARLIVGGEVVLSPAHAQVCETGIREVVAAHGFRLHAGAIMRTHLHVVVTSPSREGADVLRLFKGVLSRRLGQHFAIPASKKWWTRHGSHRLLTSDVSFLAAVRYVLREQESPIITLGLDAPSAKPASPAG